MAAAWHKSEYSSELIAKTALELAKIASAINKAFVLKNTYNIVFGLKNMDILNKIIVAKIFLIPLKILIKGS